MSGLSDLCTAVNPADLGAFRQYSRLNSYTSGSSSNDNDKRLNGSVNHTYSTDIVPLLDEAIVTNNLYLLSIEQERFMSRYFREAETVLSEDMKQFDEFLGGYNV